MAKTIGYSGTPLTRKLGIGDGHCVHCINAPAGYRRLLAPLPPGVRLVDRLSAKVDLVHLFVISDTALANALRTLRRRIRADACIWVSWPKKASNVPTTVTEGLIRDLALPLGLVDIKVCAVNEVWSGLKLVIRRELRN